LTLLGGVLAVVCSFAATTDGDASSFAATTISPLGASSSFAATTISPLGASSSFAAGMSYDVAVRNSFGIQFLVVFFRGFLFLQRSISGT
jgi:predicted transcriptional regulator